MIQRAVCLFGSMNQGVASWKYPSKRAPSCLTLLCTSHRDPRTEHGLAVARRKSSLPEPDPRRTIRHHQTGFAQYARVRLVTAISREIVYKSSRSPFIVAGLLLCPWVAGCGDSPKLPATLPPKTQAASTPPESVDSVRPDDWFEDVTAASGVDFRSQTGREAGRSTLLETLGSGVALEDFDGDGDLDLLLAGGGALDAKTGLATGVPPGYFLNDGQGRFSSGLERLPGADWTYSHGVAVGDFDRDGSPDPWLSGFGGGRLLRNDGKGTFRDATTPAGPFGSDWNVSAVLVDLNGDGFQDLYVATYVEFDPTRAATCDSDGHPDVCPPQKYTGQPDRLWLNQGDGTFVDASEAAGLAAPGRALGVLAADFDGDRIADVYVANDGEPNRLYLGSEAFPLKEVALSAGVAVGETGVPEGSMGIAWGDVTGDGLGDLLVTNFELEDSSLYENLGGGLFAHATAKRGLAGVGRLDVGFGTGFVDFDGDDRLDLFVLNGHVVYRSRQSPFAQYPLLLKNDSTGRFRNVSKAGGTLFRRAGSSRGAAWGDLDNDGGIDLVVTDLEDRTRVLRNRTSAGRAAPDRATVSLFPRGGDADGIGARIRWSGTAGDVWGHPSRGSGWCSHSPALWRVPSEVNVEWSSGRTERFTGLTPGSRVRLREGAGQ